MLNTIIRSTIVTLVLAVIVCGAYPLAVTAIGKVLFHDKANGGVVTLKDGTVVGARLVGQVFSRPEYFHPRPSAAGEKGYDAANSTGSNLGPTSKKLADTIKTNVDGVLKENPELKVGAIPVDMITASGSGLDPHISPANAFAQADRIARSRNVRREKVDELIRQHVEGPQLGFLGEPVVNVLLLNLDLDRLMPIRR